MIGFLTRTWGLVKGTGKIGLAAAGVGAGYVGLKAANHENGLQGVVSDIVDPAARVTGGAGPEQTFASFYKFLKLIGEFLKRMNIGGGVPEMFVNFGNKGLGLTKTPEEENAALPLTDKNRSDRIYDKTAEGTNLSTYRIDGPNGSPPSVKMSTEPETISNTIFLGLKGIKDGVGVAAGWAGGIVASAMDIAGVDALTSNKSWFDSLGRDGWFTATSRAVSGAVNETTDIVVYDGITRSIRGAWGLATGQGFTGYTADRGAYEPTIRSEADATVYNVASKLSGAGFSALGGAWALGAGKLVASGAASVMETLKAPFVAASVGKDVAMSGGKSAAVAAASMLPVPGIKGPTPR